MPLAAGGVYAALGGPEPFWRIARAFYGRVAKDEAWFRGIFPGELEGAIQNQAEFLMQYFGGPQAYSQRKGHPRLRARHMNFKIDVAARNRWVEHMRGALVDAEIPELIRGVMMDYFERTATFMMNSE